MSDYRREKNEKTTTNHFLMNVFADKQGVNLIELDYIIEYTLSSMIGIMSYWFKQSNRLPSVELFELLNRLMEQGVMKQLPQNCLVSDTLVKRA